MIDSSAIMRMLEEYKKSPAGKEKFRNYINNLVTTGGAGAKTSGGSHVTTLNDMRKYAEELILMLKSIAYRKQLPESVQRHFDSLQYSEPREIHGEWVIEIMFMDDLSRMSLRVKNKDGSVGRTGDGIDNIVSLFDTGYEASKSVYGYWDRSDGTSRRIKSKKERDGIGFMQEVVDDFNNTFAGREDVYAKITADEEYYLRD